MWKGIKNFVIILKPDECRTYFSFGEKSTISGTICEEAGASEVSKILIGFLTPE